MYCLYIERCHQIYLSPFGLAFKVRLKLSLIHTIDSLNALNKILVAYPLLSSLAYIVHFKYKMISFAFNAMYIKAGYH